MLYAPTTQRAQTAPAPTGRETLTTTLLVSRRLALLLAAALLLALLPLARPGSAQASDQGSLVPPSYEGSIEVTSGDGLVPSVRWDGKTRFETAGLIATDDTEYANDFAGDAIVLARADIYPDALAGSYLAGLEDVPILLTPPDSLDASTMAAVEDYDPSTIYLLGGEVALDANVEAQLAENYDVTRIGGAERIETAALIADESDTGDVNGTPTAIVASGADFPDALVSGALSVAGNLPLLLAYPDRLPELTRDALTDSGAEQVILAGGTVAVSQEVEDEIAALGLHVIRIGGETRVETAIEFADYAVANLGFSTSHVNLARGDIFADALTLGPHAGDEPAPILLVQGDTLGESVTGYLNDGLTCGDFLHVAGGTEGISEQVEQEAREAATEEGPCDLELTPETATNLLAETHTVTATASNNGDGGTAGTEVDFTVTSEDVANETITVFGPESATVVTDASGAATFDFNSAVEGDFTIEACATLATGEERCEEAMKTYSTDPFVNELSVDGVREHQAALQAIADANDGTRASGFPGYDASIDYIVGQLEALGLSPTIQSFDFLTFLEQEEAEFEQVSPTPETYTVEEATTPGGDTEAADFAVLTYSGSGDTTARAVPVDLELGEGNASTSGCEPEDFADFPDGAIALMQRGTCPFGDKVLNAQDAGASGAIIINQGDSGDPDRQDLFFGTLGSRDDIAIPAIATSYPLGVEFADAATDDEPVLRIATDTLVEPVTTSNVIVDIPGNSTTGGPTFTQAPSPDVVMLGAHLDSVLEGPGINDNGSGTAAILEVAQEIVENDVQLPNTLRFAWWGAEESGLVGSTYYVDNVLINEDFTGLTPEGERVKGYLNFDMVGSPNFVRFVYDGDGSAFPEVGGGPDGSDNIETTFADYFTSQGLESAETEFSGRSDYAEFLVAGIPSGGLFTGAEGIKTEEEAAIYGGTAGEAYDPCYHQACDTFDNVSLTALEQNTDAIGHSAIVYGASTAGLIPDPEAAGSGGAAAAPYAND